MHKVYFPFTECHLLCTDFALVVLPLLHPFFILFGRSQIRNPWKSTAQDERPRPPQREPRRFTETTALHRSPVFAVQIRGGSKKVWDDRTMCYSDDVHWDVVVESDNESEHIHQPYKIGDPSQGMIM